MNCTAGDNIEQRAIELVSNLGLAFYLASILTFYLTYVLRHSLLHVLGHRRGPQHLEMVIWCSGPGVAHCIPRSPHGSAEKVDEDEEGERGEKEEEGGGVVPLLKSRDPHLEGGEKINHPKDSMVSGFFLIFMGSKHPPTE